MSKARMDGEELSPALRRHLSHIRSCERSGGSLKAYASRQGLSLHTLYQAKKRLRQLGIPMAHGRSTKSLSKVQVPTPGTRFIEAVSPPSDPERVQTRWKLRFGNGVVLENTTPLSGDILRLLLEELESRS